MRHFLRKVVLLGLLSQRKATRLLRCGISVKGNDLRMLRGVEQMRECVSNPNTPQLCRMTRVCIVLSPLPWHDGPSLARKSRRQLPNVLLQRKQPTLWRHLTRVFALSRYFLPDVTVGDSMRRNSEELLFFWSVALKYRSPDIRLKMYRLCHSIREQTC